jgi:hypothetical protein
LSLTIDPLDVIGGTGSCGDATFDFGFRIEGTATEETIAGNLIAESGGERVDTPFTGIRRPDLISAHFDYTHSADGENLRLYGDLNADIVE